MTINHCLISFWVSQPRESFNTRTQSELGNRGFWSARRPKGHSGRYLHHSLAEARSLSTPILFIPGKPAFHTISFLVPSAFSYGKPEFSQKREKYCTQCVGCMVWSPGLCFWAQGVSPVSILTDWLWLIPLTNSCKYNQQIEIVE